MFFTFGDCEETRILKDNEEAYTTLVQTICVLHFKESFCLSKTKDNFKIIQKTQLNKWYQELKTSFEGENVGLVVGYHVIFSLITIGEKTKFPEFFLET